MRRPSVSSVASDASGVIGGSNNDNFIADVVAWLTKKYDRFVNGDVPKSKEQEKLDALAEIIKTYRGVAEPEREEAGDVLWCDSAAFDIGMCIVILFNTLVIGLETDLSSGSKEWYWAVLEFIFVSIFVVEICIKVKYHGPRWMWTGLMNLLCTLIAVLATIDFLILFPLRAGGVIESSGVLRMLSLLRIVGLLRLVRVVRESPALEELHLLLQGVLDSAATIVWVVLLLMAFLYINAILCTKMIGHAHTTYGFYTKMSGGWDHEQFFGTVGRSMITLLQVMTLDGWSSNIARHVLENQWYMSLFFLLFLLLSTHGLLNVVVSVIVQHTINAAKKNAKRVEVREQRQREQELDDMKALFLVADEDGSGEVDVDEYMAASRNPEVQWRLKQLGLQVEDAARLFEVIDGSGARSLNINEFVRGCSKLKGPAMSKDLLAIQAQADKLAENMDMLSTNLAESEKIMRALDEVSLRISRRYAPAVRGVRAKISHSKAGTEPSVPAEKSGNPEDQGDSVTFGNRPQLPLFPSSFM